MHDESERNKEAQTDETQICMKLFYSLSLIIDFWGYVGVFEHSLKLNPLWWKW